jgi:hypothetical protein
MSSIRSRLGHLEERAGDPGRCDNCQSWGPRIIKTDWRSGQPLASGPPERCPKCDYEPTVIIVEEIEDWRGQRNARPQ